MLNRLIDKLERRGRHWAIPNLTLYLVFGQSLAYVLALTRPSFLNVIGLLPRAVMQGEVWRPFTFVFYPPASHPVFVFFVLYFLWLMGTALENHWGAFRYNIFLLIGYVATVGSAFIVPDAMATNLFLTGSVFLAFAWLYPDFVIYLFFILPIRIKWLALLAWLGYLLTLILGTWVSRLMVLASIANFLVFFGAEIIQRMRSAKRRMDQKAEQMASREKPFHTCAVCGITDRTHRDMDFRYCPDCGGELAYCTEHLRNHEHRRPAT